MKTYQKRLPLFLIGLFLAFSFNAYACVVPVYPDVSPTEGRNCAVPGEEPISQFCDGFKTLAVQSDHDNPSTGQAHIPLMGELSLSLPDLVRSKALYFPPDRGAVVFQQDLLLLISVFRI